MPASALQTLRISGVLILMLSNIPLFAQNDFFDDANARIEQHRKADISVSVVDSNGTPVVGANVEVEMKRHQFRWGTAVVANRINSGSSTNQIYRDKLLENFNSVVFENDLKWPAWEGIWGSNLGWNQAQQALDWLDANNMPTRGHYAAWATLNGVDGYGPNNSNSANIPGALFPHITDKLQTVGDRITEWDVINHPVGWGPTTYEDVFGLSFYSSIVNHTRSVAPTGATLWMNEDNILTGSNVADHYEQIIQYLMNDGATIDGIGFQGHFKSSWGRNQPDTHERIYDQMERFSNHVPNLLITEFDIDVGVFDGNGNLLFYDEVEHAIRMNDYLISAFSHPDLKGVIMWGFWEGAHWLPTAALYNQNWTERLALSTYQDLVFNQWWTTESGDTNSQGLYNLRGFKGDYEITVEHEGQTYVQNFNTNSQDAIFKVPAPQGNFAASSFEVVSGIPTTGDIDSLSAADDDYLTLLPNLKSGISSISVELEAISPISNPTSIQLLVEDAANTPGLTTYVEFWNWSSSTFQTIDNYETNLLDTENLLSVSGFLPSFVDASSGVVRCRIRWEKEGLTLFSPWNVRLDNFQWAIAN